MNANHWFSILGAILVLAAAITFYLGSNSAPATTPAVEVCDLIDNDLDGEVDEGFATTCTEDADCGESGFYGEEYCQDDDVWRDYYAQSCEGAAGTCKSECVAQQTQRIVSECREGCAQAKCT